MPEEGVAFTGANIFSRCKTYIQEADPWEWLAALKRIESLDVQVIVPGHGEPTDRSYCKRQAEVVENWIGAVDDMVRRGPTEAEALEQQAPEADPFPIGQHRFMIVDRVNAMNVSNLYRRIGAIALLRRRLGLTRGGCAASDAVSEFPPFPQGVPLGGAPPAIAVGTGVVCASSASGVAGAQPLGGIQESGGRAGKADPSGRPFSHISVAARGMYGWARRA